MSFLPLTSKAWFPIPWGRDKPVSHVSTEKVYAHTSNSFVQNITHHVIPLGECFYELIRLNGCIIFY